MITIKIARLKIIDVTLVSLILCIFAVTDILCEKTFWILEIFYIQTCKMYSRYPKKQTLVLLFHICPLCHCNFSIVFLGCISQLCFSTGFLDYLSQLAEEEAILDIGAAVPSVPCVRLGSHHFAGEPSLRSPRGGHNTQYREDTTSKTQTRDTKCI